MVRIKPVFGLPLPEAPKVRRAGLYLYVEKSINRSVPFIYSPPNPHLSTWRGFIFSLPIFQGK
jgi:hypothetical protein